MERLLWKGTLLHKQKPLAAISAHASVEGNFTLPDDLHVQQKIKFAKFAVQVLPKVVQDKETKLSYKMKHFSDAGINFQPCALTSSDLSGKWMKFNDFLLKDSAVGVASVEGRSLEETSVCLFLIPTDLLGPYMDEEAQQLTERLFGLFSWRSAEFESIKTEAPEAVIEELKEAEDTEERGRSEMVSPEQASEPDEKESDDTTLTTKTSASIIKQEPDDDDDQMAENGKDTMAGSPETAEEIPASPEQPMVCLPQEERDQEKSRSVTTDHKSDPLLQKRAVVFIQRLSMLSLRGKDPKVKQKPSSELIVGDNADNVDKAKDTQVSPNPKESKASHEKSTNKKRRKRPARTNKNKAPDKVNPNKSRKKGGKNRKVTSRDRRRIISSDESSDSGDSDSTIVGYDSWESNPPVDELSAVTDSVAEVFSKGDTAITKGQISNNEIICVGDSRCESDSAPNVEPPVLVPEVGLTVSIEMSGNTNVVPDTAGDNSRNASMETTNNGTQRKANTLSEEYPELEKSSEEGEELKNKEKSLELDDHTSNEKSPSATKFKCTMKDTTHILTKGYEYKVISSPGKVDQSCFIDLTNTEECTSDAIELSTDISVAETAAEACPGNSKENEAECTLTPSTTVTESTFISINPARDQAETSQRDEDHCKEIDISTVKAKPGASNDTCKKLGETEVGEPESAEKAMDTDETAMKRNNMDKETDNAVNGSNKDPQLRDGNPRILYITNGNKEVDKQSVDDMCKCMDMTETNEREGSTNPTNNETKDDDVHVAKNAASTTDVCEETKATKQTEGAEHNNTEDSFFRKDEIESPASPDPNAENSVVNTEPLKVCTVEEHSEDTVNTNTKPPEVDEPKANRMMQIEGSKAMNIQETQTGGEKSRMNLSSKVKSGHDVKTSTGHRDEKFKIDQLISPQSKSRILKKAPTVSGYAPSNVTRMVTAVELTPSKTTTTRRMSNIITLTPHQEDRRVTTKKPLLPDQPEAVKMLQTQIESIGSQPVGNQPNIRGSVLSLDSNPKMHLNAKKVTLPQQKTSDRNSQGTLDHHPKETSSGKLTGNALTHPQRRHFPMTFHQPSTQSNCSLTLVHQKNTSTCPLIPSVSQGIPGRDPRQKSKLVNYNANVNNPHNTSTKPTQTQESINNAEPATHLDGSSYTNTNHHPQKNPFECNTSTAQGPSAPTGRRRIAYKDYITDKTKKMVSREQQTHSVQKCNKSVWVKLRKPLKHAVVQTDDTMFTNNLQQLAMKQSVISALQAVVTSVRTSMSSPTQQTAILTLEKVMDIITRTANFDVQIAPKLQPEIPPRETVLKTLTVPEKTDESKCLVINTGPEVKNVESSKKMLSPDSTTERIESMEKQEMEVMPAVNAHHSSANDPRIWLSAQNQISPAAAGNDDYQTPTARRVLLPTPPYPPLYQYYPNNLPQQQSPEGRRQSSEVESSVPLPGMTQDDPHPGKVSPVWNNDDQHQGNWEQNDREETVGQRMPEEDLNGANSYNEIPYRETTKDENSHGEIPNGGNAYGETPNGGNAYGETPNGGNSYGETPNGGNSYGVASYSETSYSATRSHPQPEMIDDYFEIDDSYPIQSPLPYTDDTSYQPHYLNEYNPYLDSGNPSQDDHDIKMYDSPMTYHEHNTWGNEDQEEMYGHQNVKPEMILEQSVENVHREYIEESRHTKDISLKKPGKSGLHKMINALFESQRPANEDEDAFLEEELRKIFNEKQKKGKKGKKALNPQVQAAIIRRCQQERRERKRMRMAAEQQKVKQNNPAGKKRKNKDTPEPNPQTVIPARGTAHFLNGKYSGYSVNDRIDRRRKEKDPNNKDKGTQKRSHVKDGQRYKSNSSRGKERGRESSGSRKGSREKETSSELVKEKRSDKKQDGKKNKQLSASGKGSTEKKVMSDQVTDKSSERKKEEKKEELKHPEEAASKVKDEVKVTQVPNESPVFIKTETAPRSTTIKAPEQPLQGVTYPLQPLDAASDTWPNPRESLHTQIEVTLPVPGEPEDPDLEAIDIINLSLHGVSGNDTRLVTYQRKRPALLPTPVESKRPALEINPATTPTGSDIGYDFISSDEEFTEDSRNNTLLMSTNPGAFPDDSTNDINSRSVCLLEESPWRKKQEQSINERMLQSHMRHYQSDDELSEGYHESMANPNCGQQPQYCNSPPMVRDSDDRDHDRDIDRDHDRDNHQPEIDIDERQQMRMSDNVNPDGSLPLIPFLTQIIYFCHDWKEWENHAERQRTIDEWVEEIVYTKQQFIYSFGRHKNNKFAKSMIWDGEVIPIPRAYIITHDVKMASAILKYLSVLCSYRLIMAEYKRAEEVSTRETFPVRTIQEELQILRNLLISCTYTFDAVMLHFLYRHERADWQLRRFVTDMSEYCKFNTDHTKDVLNTVTKKGKCFERYANKEKIKVETYLTNLHRERQAETRLPSKERSLRPESNDSKQSRQEGRKRSGSNDRGRPKQSGSEPPRKKTKHDEKRGHRSSDRSMSPDRGRDSRDRDSRDRNSRDRDRGRHPTRSDRSVSREKKESKQHTHDKTDRVVHQRSNHSTPSEKRKESKNDSKQTHDKMEKMVHQRSDHSTPSQKRKEVKSDSKQQTEERTGKVIHQRSEHSVPTEKNRQRVEIDSKHSICKSNDRFTERDGQTDKIFKSDLNSDQQIKQITNSSEILESKIHERKKIEQSEPLNKSATHRDEKAGYSKEPEGQSIVSKPVQTAMLHSASLWETLDFSDEDEEQEKNIFVGFNSLRSQGAPVIIPGLDLLPSSDTTPSTSAIPINKPTDNNTKTSVSDGVADRLNKLIRSIKDNEAKFVSRSKSDTTDDEMPPLVSSKDTVSKPRGFLDKRLPLDHVAAVTATVPIKEENEPQLPKKKRPIVWSQSQKPVFIGKRPGIKFNIGVKSKGFPRAAVKSFTNNSVTLKEKMQ